MLCSTTAIKCYYNQTLAKYANTDVAMYYEIKVSTIHTQIKDNYVTPMSQSNTRVMCNDTIKDITPLVCYAAPHCYNQTCHTLLWGR